MPKRGYLGFSFPVLVGVLLVFLVLFVIGFASGPLGKSMIGDFGLPFGLDRPEPKLPAEEVFHLFGFPVVNSIVGAWVTIIFVVGFSYVITRRMKVVPGRLQSVFEVLLGGLYNFCQNVAGEQNGRRFFPVVATIFLFVAFNAWLSLIPGFGSIEIINTEGHHVHLLRGANTDINMPLALALVSFVFVEYFGLRSLGIRYLGKFLNLGQFFSSMGLIFRGRLKAGLGGLFSGLINIFVGMLEALSELIRIVSFTFRLFGVSTAGEILLLVGIFLGIRVLIEFFIGIELLFGFVQALIFAGLTLVFLTLATAHHGTE
ncbi:F0F1 ATP synthase subunit A [Chloroflexota bacterium]